MTQPEVRTVPSVPDAGAALFLEALEESIQRRGSFAVVLSGGSTPLPMYRQLAEHRDLPWERVRFFWGDERFVPHDHPDSNYRAAREALLEPLGLPGDRIFPWPILETPERSAETYARTLQKILGEPLHFDLTFLGLGDDGHTASLFPGTGAVEATGLTVASHPEDKGPRLSLTAEALSRSRTVAFLVSGEGKREALEGTLHSAHNLERYPAQAVEAQERLLFLTDLT